MEQHTNHACSKTWKIPETTIDRETNTKAQKGTQTHIKTKHTKTHEHENKQTDAHIYMHLNLNTHICNIQKKSDTHENHTKSPTPKNYIYIDR